MIRLSIKHQEIVGRGLSALPLSARDDALHYIESRLRPILEITDSDVRSAVGGAIAKYGSLERVRG